MADRETSREGSEVDQSHTAEAAGEAASETITGIARTVEQSAERAVEQANERAEAAEHAAEAIADAAIHQTQEQRFVALENSNQELRQWRDDVGGQMTAMQDQFQTLTGQLQETLQSLKPPSNPLPAPAPAQTPAPAEIPPQETQPASPEPNSQSKSGDTRAEQPPKRRKYLL